MNPSLKNVAASVRQRLLNLARERGEDFQSVLIRYGGERLLYRLSRSSYRDHLVLKGATLFLIWMNTPYRPTRDLDFEGWGDDTPATHEGVFRDICKTHVVPDGLEFDSESVTGAVIREDQEYGGVRIKLHATLAGARIPLQVDIGFGDAITPAALESDFPTLLDFPAPHLRIYPRETVVAEKFQAMTKLGLTNTRLKDFSDVWKLSREFDFDGVILSAAMKATYTRRQTQLPDEPPIAFTAEFYDDAAKIQQSQSLQEKGTLKIDLPTLAEAISALREFLMPPSANLVRNQPFDMFWAAGGPWTEK